MFCFKLFIRDRAFITVYGMHVLRGGTFQNGTKTEAVYLGGCNKNASDVAVAKQPALKQELCM